MEVTLDSGLLLALLGLYGFLLREINTIKVELKECKSALALLLPKSDK